MVTTFFTWKDINHIRTDHSDNIKRGGTCLYFKKSLPLRKIELSRITECLLCKVNVKGQVGFVIVSYCSPSQTSSQFDDFFSVVSIYVFHQLISEPTHILPNSLSCIDLISPHLVAKKDISKMGKKKVYWAIIFNVISSWKVFYQFCWFWDFLANNEI